MSKFNFLDLTDDVRQLMVEEINNDIAEEKLYISERLNEAGKEVYPNFLLETAIQGNEELLTSLLESDEYFNSTYLRQNKPVKMPSNAASLLAQSEFNRFYIRAVCRASINQNISEVEIYRARESSWARAGSEDQIGEKILAEDLLKDLRTSIGVQPQILPEINSGLSVKLVE
ncbi:hypothetical protein G7051_08965 [Dysgonomonas sp. HDW5B]|uniref:hypothetical protein n=1 Tax=Dysgonomonas sp. HDW5B TaxID=2714927 RepID=UPI00140A53A6|nr:hypothetical protein [Dysgonomonas sp. HDW5B]QIK54463.1 hypothetical protein G7051_08965 [Dysgonomonas sp. HDW5B]